MAVIADGADAVTQAGVAADLTPVVKTIPVALDSKTIRDLEPPAQGLVVELFALPALNPLLLLSRRGPG